MSGLFGDQQRHRALRRLETQFRVVRRPGAVLFILADHAGELVGRCYRGGIAASAARSGKADQAQVQRAADCRVRARPRPEGIAAIGYCFGGAMSFELARDGADILAAIGFHTALATKSPAPASGINAKILACIGDEDPVAPPEQRAAFAREMSNARADWQLHLYGGVAHSFTVQDAAKLGRPDFARYDAHADSRSWAAMIGLFDELFGRGD